MSYLLYLMFRCDFDVMESLEKFGIQTHPSFRSSLSSRRRSMVPVVTDPQPLLLLLISEDGV